jgi:hypothetical protein
MRLKCLLKCCYSETKSFPVLKLKRKKEKLWSVKEQSKVLLSNYNDDPLFAKKKKHNDPR